MAWTVSSSQGTAIATVACSLQFCLTVETRSQPKGGCRHEPARIEPVVAQGHARAPAVVPETIAVGRRPPGGPPVDRNHAARAGMLPPRLRGVAAAGRPPARRL